MSLKSLFSDGLKNLLSSLVNERSAVAANEIVSGRVLGHELRAILRTGLGNKIIRVKNGYALKEDLVFENPGDKTFYKDTLAKPVKKAGSFMLAFGRGIIVINEFGSDLSKPLVGEPKPYKLDVFSGDMISASGVSMDLKDPRYFKPQNYNVRGQNFHHSRVIDFSYVEPAELDSPTYQYGGVAEFELIHNQLVNDGVVERASATIVDKNSTMFYSIKGFKDALRNKQESDILSFYSATEKARSIFGAGLIDQEDTAYTVEQKLTDLDKVDLISLRRLGMVTGIPRVMLYGENSKGLGSTGQTEKTIFNEMIEILQQDYYLAPINDLLAKLGKTPVSFSETQNITPAEKAEYDSKVIINAKALWEMGEDSGKYLEEKGVTEKDSFGEMFSE